MSIVVILSAAVSRQKRTAIASAITRYGESVPLSESSYAINTDLSAEELSANLKHDVGIKEGLYVIPVKRSYRGPAPAKVRQWLRNLGQGRTPAE
jgi:hypothetical protein